MNLRLRFSVILMLLWNVLHGKFASGVTNQSLEQQENLRTNGLFEVAVQWKVLDFNFKSHTDRRNQIQSGKFIQKNNIIGGMKLHGNRIFMSVPRHRPGVPLTLSYFEYHGKHLKGPRLNPFPSWEMQQLSNCMAFQNVQSMEIDRYDRMWVIDSGRINVLTQTPLNLCPPKLVLLDLNTNAIILTHVFSSVVASPSSAFLNDLVVACTSRKNCWAYITNSMENKLTVYCLEMNKSWSTKHSSMNPEISASNITIKGINYTGVFGIDGIVSSGLRDNYERVYYGPLSSYALYSVATKTLKEAMSPGTKTLLDSDVRMECVSVSQADGLTTDNTGQLFYGLLNRNALAYVQIKPDTTVNSTEVQYAQSDKKLTWIDTFAFDNKGHLYLTSNRFNLYLIENLNPTVYNFRIIRVHTGTKSYMYP